MGSLHPLTEALAGAILALFSIMIARVYLREVQIETRPGLTLDERHPQARIERTSEARGVGLAYLLAALAGIALLLHGMLRMRL